MEIKNIEEAKRMVLLDELLDIDGVEGKEIKTWDTIVYPDLSRVIAFIPNKNSGLKKEDSTYMLYSMKFIAPIFKFLKKEGVELIGVQMRKEKDFPLQIFAYKNKKIMYSIIIAPREDADVDSPEYKKKKTEKKKPKKSKKKRKIGVGSSPKPKKPSKEN